MGNTQSYPNAKEEVETTIFYVDFVCWSIAAVVKTTLLVIWLLYAYFNINVIPIRIDTPKPNDEILASGTKSPSKSAQTPTEKTRSQGTSTEASGGTIQTSESQRDRDQSEMSQKNASYKMDKRARIYITLSMVAALLYAYFYTALHTLRYLGIVGEFSCTLTAVSLGLGWALNRLFLYFYLMLRLKVSFQGTFLEITQVHYNLLMRTYLTLFTIGVLFYVFWGSYVGCDGLNILISFLPLNGFDSVCALICLYIFIKKLNCLVNMDQVAYDKDPKAMSDLKYLVNKFLIISLFAIGFTYFVSLLFFIYPMKCLGGIDTMVNVFCLMITTTQYDLYYRNTCCLCRKWCEKSFKFGSLSNDMRI